MCPCVIFIGVSVWRCVLLQNAMIKLFILLCVSVCHFHWCVRVAVCPALKCYDIIIPITLCVRVAVCPSSKCYDIIFILLCVIFIGVSVWRCVLLQNGMIYLFILFCVSVCHFHWCVRVAVCPASK